MKNLELFNKCPIFNRLILCELFITEKAATWKITLTPKNDKILPPLKLFCLFHKLTTAKVSFNVALTVNVTTTPVYPKSFREIIIIIIYNLLFNQYTPEHHLLISLACLLVRMLILTSPGFSRAANTDRSYNKLHISFVPQCLLLKEFFS